MKKLFQTFLQILLFNFCYCQIVDSDSLRNDLTNLNGRWTWVCSYQINRRLTPQSEKVEIQIEILNHSQMKILENEKLIAVFNINLTDVIDKSKIRNSKVVWRHFTLRYTFQGEMISTKAFWFTERGTIDWWDDNSLQITDGFISGRTISTFQKNK